MPFTRFSHHTVRARRPTLDALRRLHVELDFAACEGR